jgi:hypothetical protein
MERGREMTMTKKEFFERCKEVMASGRLGILEKAEKVKYLSTRLIEDTWDKIPEARDLRKRWEATEKKLAGHGGFSYCPHDGEWSPDLPPAIKALDREWLGLRHQKIEEVSMKAMKTLRKINAEARA